MGSGAPGCVWPSTRAEMHVGWRLRSSATVPIFCWATGARPSISRQANSKLMISCKGLALHTWSSSSVPILSAGWCSSCWRVEATHRMKELEVMSRCLSLEVLERSTMCCTGSIDTTRSTTNSGKSSRNIVKGLGVQSISCLFVPRCNKVPGDRFCFEAPPRRPACSVLCALAPQPLSLEGRDPETLGLRFPGVGSYLCVL
mmetsp:Transcript_46723/g.113796  ORF Transcript_46723/g.113796 Transcript_46723/m.113796 type:complete len:201 (+) Transcript_46723:189-791(+)